MPYIIDGNNLIGCSADISLQDPEARKKLMTLLKSFQETRKTKVTVFFDGEPDEIARQVARLLDEAENVV